MPLSIRESAARESSSCSLASAIRWRFCGLSIRCWSSSDVAQRLHLLVPQTLQLPQGLLAFLLVLGLTKSSLGLPQPVAHLVLTPGQVAEPVEDLEVFLPVGLLLRLGHALRLVAVLSLRELQLLQLLLELRGIGAGPASNCSGCGQSGARVPAASAAPDRPTARRPVPASIRPSWRTRALFVRWSSDVSMCSAGGSKRLDRRRVLGLRQRLLRLVPGHRPGTGERRRDRPCGRRSRRSVRPAA